jgi:type I restriction enzyme M protein
VLNTETKRRIDAARDVLVGVAPNPMTQVDQITYALIYKFMDDMDQSAIKLGGEPSFFVGDLEPYAYSKLMDSRLGNQERMNLYAEALTKFAEANQLPELFRTIFRAAFLPYRSPETLGLFLKEISFFDYSHPEELGNAYEYLLSIMSAQGDAGQFRTPRHIIDFMVDVLDPSKTDRVLDPACGTGGFLVSTYNHILDKHDGIDDPTNEERPLTPDERRKLMENFEGYDIDPSMVRIAQVNMYLHLFKNPKIYQYDSLTNEERWNDKFDVILANPPFMSPKGGIKPHNKFGIQSNRSEVLFVDYISSHLKPNGRAAIIVPEGILFKTDKAYRALRKNLIDESLVAVVSLPSGVFKPYSGVKTSILILNKDIAKQRDSILTIDVKNDGFSLGDTRRPIASNDLPSAIESLASWLKSELSTGKLSEVVSKQTLLDDPKHLLTKQGFADNPTGEFEFVKFSDVIETIVPPKKVPTSEILRVGRYPVIDQSMEFVAGRTNDDSAVMFPSAPVIIFGDHTCVVKYVDFPFAQGADGIKILKFNDSILPKFAYYVLKGKPIESTGYQRHFSLLKNYEFPVPPLEVQEKIVTELDAFSAIIEGSKTIVENWKPRIEVDSQWPVLPLSKIAVIKGGATPSRKEATYWEGPIKWLTASNIANDGSIQGFEGISKAGLESCSSVQVPKGTTILVTRVSVGKVGYCDEDEYAFNQDLTGLIPNEELVNSRFLYYSSWRLAQLISQSATGTGVRGVTKDFVSSLQIPIPSLSTQQQIVETLDRQEAVVKEAKTLSLQYQELIKKAIHALWSNES